MTLFEKGTDNMSERTIDLTVFTTPLFRWMAENDDYRLLETSKRDQLDGYVKARIAGEIPRIVKRAIPGSNPKLQDLTYRVFVAPESVNSATFDKSVVFTLLEEAFDRIGADVGNKIEKLKDN